MTCSAPTAGACAIRSEQLKSVGRTLLLNGIRVRRRGATHRDSMSCPRLLLDRTSLLQYFTASSFTPRFRASVPASGRSRLSSTSLALRSQCRAHSHSQCRLAAATSGAASHAPRPVPDHPPHPLQSSLLSQWQRREIADQPTESLHSLHERLVCRLRDRALMSHRRTAATDREGDEEVEGSGWQVPRDIRYTKRVADQEALPSSSGGVLETSRREGWQTREVRRKTSSTSGDSD